MDAVGDRDYIIEFLFWASLLSTHLRLVYILFETSLKLDCWMCPALLIIIIKTKINKYNYYFCWKVDVSTHSGHNFFPFSVDGQKI